ncbi:hypothetical protein EZV62_025038 [Acer yangbiense]|uniref:DOMON domain-containing protein n=1 Tax=Acer yangbiense TaxID=1000413 RepID=A0A5C7GWN9_9ROSI|nr:hypothetical protein EZV62_025038 [Acer yangbiense]
MDFSLRIMLLIFACVISQLLILSSSQSCSSYSFLNQNTYRACSDLGVLKSFLHWNYNETTGTIEIAYRHASIKSQTWVAWAINPSRKGMVGSQAFVAHQTSAGIVQAYTSPVTTYGTGLEEGPLSFPVQKISAEFVNNEMIIYSMFVLPKNMTTVNHVWQDGPVNKDNSLGMHALTGENVISLATLDFLSGQIVATKLGDGSSNLMFKKIHGGLNMVSWGILMPIGVMTARYMKVLALKLRPNKENKYRTYWNIYHHGIGYSVIILSIINILKGINILEAVMIWKPIYIAILIFFGIIAAILETWTWNIVLNKRLQTSNDDSGKEKISSLGL